MYYHIGAYFPDSPFHRPGIGYVKLHILSIAYGGTVPGFAVNRLYIGADSFISSFYDLIYAVVSELSAYSCYEKFHLYCPLFLYMVS